MAHLRFGDPDVPSSAAEPTAIATVLTEDYLPGFAVLLYSLKKWNPTFSLPFYIFHSAKFAPLSEEGQALVRTLLPAAQLVEVNDTKYASLWKSCSARQRKSSKPSLLLLEAFALSEHSQVIAVHADLLCFGPITELLETRADLAAVFPADENTFHTAVLVIGAAHLTGATHAALLQHELSTECSSGSLDRIVLNDFFQPASVYALPPSLNTRKKNFPDSGIETVDAVHAEGVRLLHFEGDKPWQPHSVLAESRFHILESYWCEELCAVLHPIAENSGATAKKLLERIVPKLSAGISARSESELRRRVRSLTTRAESAEAKLQYAIGVLRETDSSKVSPVIAEGPDQELEALRQECHRECQASAALGKENAALNRTLHTLKEDHLKLKRQWEKTRHRDAQHKEVLKAFRALASYSNKVADRLEKLAGRIFLWPFRKRFRNWAAILRRLSTPPAEQEKEERPRPAAPQPEQAPGTKTSSLTQEREAYLEAGEFARLHKLQGFHQGKRCFILGDGVSLEGMDLRLLTKEVVIACDDAVQRVSELSPNFYCISNRALTPDFCAAMRKVKVAMKLLSYGMKQDIRRNNLFPGETLFFALCGAAPAETQEVHFDFSRHLLGGDSSLLTLAIPLAVHLGCREIILLAWDDLSTREVIPGPDAWQCMREKLRLHKVDIFDATTGSTGKVVPAKEYRHFFPASVSDER